MLPNLGLKETENYVNVKTIFRLLCVVNDFSSSINTMIGPSAGFFAKNSKYSIRKVLTKMLLFFFC